MAHTFVRLADRRWVRDGSLSALGHAFHEGRLCDAAALCEYLAGLDGAADFEERIRKLNGFFAIVCETKAGVFAAVDRLRSIPLFFRRENDWVSISDCAGFLASGCGATPQNVISRAEFRLTGFVTGQGTLSCVLQLRAGEILVAEETKAGVAVTTRRYFRFCQGQTVEANQDQLRGQLEDVVSRCTRRLIERAAGNTILLPLSGGWDSRLIASMLRKHDYDNVLCFSYGRPGNRESNISRHVAATLGLPWAMVPYTEGSWRKWFHSDHSKAYAAYSHNLVSVPHYQDWPAIWDLSARGLIPRGSLVSPGHLGDFAAGSHVPPLLWGGRKFARRDIIRLLYQRHYNLWPTRAGELKAELFQRIDSSLCAGDNFTRDTAASAVDEWDWEERQAKFIVNSVRVYEFWGVDWWMPFADAEFLDFWTTVPLRWRVRQRLYVPYVKQLYAQVAGVSLREASQRDGPTLQRQAVDVAMLLGCFALAKRAYSMSGARLSRARMKRTAYGKDPMAWYGAIDAAIFRREYTGLETFHSFVARYVLNELTF